MRLQLRHSFEDIISVENLLQAWQEFLPGKKHKYDVQQFGFKLMDNILQLHNDLANGVYKHGPYVHFKISDPKQRDIHKAMVRDRVLHHAIYRILYPCFDKAFIADSYSCRVAKGTHKGITRFRTFSYKVSQNNNRTCWVLKGDIKKFFASIDHATLIRILSRLIPDLKVMLLLENIIDSFEMKPGVGLPLGNLTSQLFCNVYMNELDQFIKHELKAKYYIRYADDFVLLSESHDFLVNLLPRIEDFLRSQLYLNLHPDKIFIQTLASGVDFLGQVMFPYHQVLRINTKRRMLKSLFVKQQLMAAGQLDELSFNQTMQSYLGLIKHCNSYELEVFIKNNFQLGYLDPVK